jgi:predicted PurR-regulated permease PerM
MVFSGILVNKDKLVELAKQASPLDNEIDNLYLKRIAAMSIAMVKGTFIIALLNALVTGFFLWIAGVDYVAFWILISLFVSLIPLGAGIVSVPIGVVLILTGNIWQGLLQIISYLLIVSNIDNLLRPKLVPKESGLHPALTILGIFGGIKLFGFLGIIFGPMLMIFLVTTFEVYMKYYRR